MKGKRRSIVTRVTKVTKSPVSEVFQGQIRSVLSTANEKMTATLQPFFSLQLDIQVTTKSHKLFKIGIIVDREIMSWLKPLTRFSAWLYALGLTVCISVWLAA